MEIYCGGGRGYSRTGTRGWSFDDKAIRCEQRTRSSSADDGNSRGSQEVNVNNAEVDASKSKTYVGVFQECGSTTFFMSST